MLLQRLCEYSERLRLPPPMYIATPIRWLIELDRKGRPLGLVSTADEGAGKGRGKVFLAPHIGRSSGVRAKLLADNGEYVLGLARQKSKPARVAECHKEFVTQVRRCAEATREPTVQAVLRFLENLGSGELELPEDFSPDHNLTFSVEGTLPVDLPAVQHYWAEATGAAETPSDNASKEPMQCIVCGQVRPALKRLPIKLKRIPGGQTAGVALISANVNAFESYGLKESLIAPICHGCAERFSKAANDLLERQDSHIRVGPLAYVFWTREERGFSFKNLLSDPKPDEVKLLIRSAATGQPAAVHMDVTPFYATAFSASGGRAVVRDWLETTIASVQRNLARYFTLQRLVGPGGEEGRPLGVFVLAASLYHEARQIAPEVPKALLRLALKGGRLPDWLLFQAVKRNRAEQGVTRPRAALIKMVLLSRERETKEDAMFELDSGYDSPAYLCGRLLAELEAVQRAAIPNINATLVDRFYGSASSAPASVFGRLWRGAQAHLGKLRRDRPGVCRAIEERLMEIQEKLKAREGYPRILSLEDQGLFALGYYHQRAADRAAAIARKQAKEAAAEAAAVAGI